MNTEIELSAELETAPRYTQGSPLVVAITLRNVMPGSTRFDLPQVDVWSQTSPIAFTLEKLDPPGGREELPHAHAHAEDGSADGFTLQAPEGRRMLFDLSSLKPDLQAGSYALHGSVHTRIEAVKLGTARLVVDPPAPEVARALRALLARNVSAEPSWSAFLLDNFRTIEPEEWRAFPPSVLEQLAYHRFVHRAVYGASALRALDLDAVPGLPPGAFTGESAVLRHELMCARSALDAAALAADIVQEWPELGHRCEDNARGEGLLGSLRRLAGAERRFPPLPSELPYSHELEPRP